jgi:hypothetical protein
VTKEIISAFFEKRAAVTDDSGNPTWYAGKKATCEKCHKTFILLDPPFLPIVEVEEVMIGATT